MIATQTGPKSGENFWLWFLKIVTGLFIIVLILVHLVVNHFIAEGGLLTHAQVVAYYQSPIIPIMEGFFLVFVVSHSLMGLRSIILDLKPSRGTLAVVNWILTGVGVISIIYGLWLIQVVVAQGAGA